MNNSFWVIEQSKQKLIAPGIPIYTILLFIAMYFLCATRDISVGVDTKHYYFSFFHESVRSVEPTFYIIKKIAQSLGDSFPIFLNLFALATFIPLFFFFKKNSTNVAFSLLIYLSFSNYFYPETFNTIRATASISFFLLSISFFTEKKFVLCIIYTVTAILFHYSAIVIYLLALPFFFIPKIPQKFAILAITSSVILGIFFASGFNEWALNLSTNLAFFSEDYAYHLMNLKETHFNIIGLTLGILPFSILCIFLHTEDNSKNVYYKLFLFSTILGNIFISVDLIYRITMYLSILITIILPNTIRKTSGIQRNILFYITGFIILFFLLRITLSNDSLAGIIPYSSSITF